MRKKTPVPSGPGAFPFTCQFLFHPFGMEAPLRSRSARWHAGKADYRSVWHSLFRDWHTRCGIRSCRLRYSQQPRWYTVLIAEGRQLFYFLCNYSIIGFSLIILFHLFHLLSILPSETRRYRSRRVPFLLDFLLKRAPKGYIPVLKMNLRNLVYQKSCGIFCAFLEPATEIV